MLTLRNITRLAPDLSRTLLTDVSLTIRPGERIGLIGPSGSGKSSLLRAMAMLDPISSGEILFQGKPVAEVDVPHFRRQVIYVAQRPSLINATIRANLETPFRFKSTTTNFDESRVATLFEQLNKPTSILDQTSDQLSGGERQITALVRAIQLDPLVLLLDEPTASLDDDSVAQVESLLDHWQAENESRSLVWVSHDRTQVQRVTAQVIRMEGGRLF